VHIRELVNALSALGHQVTIFTARRGAVSGPLSAEVIEVRADPVPLSMEESVNGSGQDLLLKEQRSLRLSAAILTALLTRHAQEPFDVIYERYSLWSAAGVRAAQALNIPCVVEVNAPLVEEQQRYRGLALASEAAAIEAEVFGRADVVVTVSDRVKAHAVAKGAPAERILVVPNGVDPSRFHPAVAPECVPEAEGMFVIGFAGSFKAWHGIDVLLEAFRMLRGRSTDYRTCCAGECR
jgi:glycosyltransferase involved in cell wall biosynthesis